MQNDWTIEEVMISDLELILENLEKLDIGFAKVVTKNRIEQLKQGSYPGRKTITPKSDE